MDALWAEGIALSPSARAWVFPEQRVIFTQSYGDAPTLDDANGLVDFFLWLERLEGPDAMPKTPAPSVIHDWRSFKSVSMNVRQRFVTRRKEIGTLPGKLVVAVAVNPVLRMAMRTVALAGQLVTHAVPLDLVDDPKDALVAAGATDPDPLVHLRLREAWRHRQA
jgi:hypothetical protein